MKKKEFTNKIVLFENKLKRFASRMVNSHYSSDVVQDVLIKLWSQKNKIKDIKNLEAYAMRMTKNLCIDYIRKSKNIKLNEISRTNMLVASSESSPYDFTEHNDTIEITKRIIDELPELQKIVIHLRDIEQYDFEEMEKILDIKQGAIRANLSRARKSIRNKLIKIYSYED